MQTATSGASIYYTTDGSTPTQSSTLYAGAMTLSSTAAVNAKAFKSGANPSAVAAASFTNTGTGNTYYVAKSGSDSNSCAQARSLSAPKRTIGSAILCLSAGATLQIRGGTYDERIDRNISVPNGISWSNPVTIMAYPGEKVTLFPTQQSDVPVIEFIPAAVNRYIIFDGLTLDGTNVLAGYVVYLGAATDHIRFTNVEIKNGGASQIGNGTGNVSNGAGVSGTGHEFVNCNVHDNGRDPGNASGASAYGFYVGSGSDHLIERCKVYNNGGYGIHVYGHPSRVTIRYSEIYANSQDSTMTTAGIIVSSGDGHKVYGNIVRNDRRGGIQVYNGCTNCLIYNNTVYGNAWGISVSQATTGVILRNNIVYLNSGGNIMNDGGQGAIISNNLISDPGFIDAGTGDFHLRSGSPGIDAGVALTEVAYDMDGTPRPQGGQYDIGAYEYH